MRHEHDSFRDVHTNSIKIACNCFCPDCYSEEERARVGQGCLCPDCVCQETGVKKLAAAYYREEVETKTKTRKIVDVPLPDEVKTGTCKQCGKATFRNGNRGRFPVLCQECKK